MQKYLLCAFYKNMDEVTLEMVYKELQNIRRIMEEFMEKFLEHVLPKEELDEKERREIEKVKKENIYIPLEKVRDKFE